MNTKKLNTYDINDLEKDYGKLTFSNFISSYRLGEEIDQEELAKLLGISKQSLCDLEKGRRIPSPKRAAEIAKKLKLIPESLIALAIQDKK